MVGAYAVGRIAKTMDTLSRFKRLLAGSIVNLLCIWSWHGLYLALL